MGRTDHLQKKLAEFSASIEPPPNVLVKMRLRLVDTLAASVANAREEYVDRLVSIYSKEVGQATVWGRTERLRWPRAAFINGCLAHGSDYDDTQPESAVHASSVVVSAAHAAAEAHDLTQQSLLESIAVGLEVAVRIGAAAGHGFNERGFHATSLVGVFGAAMACGRILGLSPGHLSNALGFSGSLASGLIQFLDGGGSDVKRLHAGWAAQAGCEAALWAGAGLTAPDQILEGRFGFYRSHLRHDTDSASVHAGLGSEWRCETTLAKRYPCCHHLHSTIDLALEWRDQLSPGVESAVVLLPPGPAIEQVCEPQAVRRNPQDPHLAKFSAYYVVAAALLDGKVDHDTFSWEALERRVTREMMEVVSYRVQQPQKTLGLGYPGGLELCLRDGRVLKGWLPEPRAMSESDIRAKLHSCCRIAGLDATMILGAVDEGLSTRHLAATTRPSSHGVPE